MNRVLISVLCLVAISFAQELEAPEEKPIDLVVVMDTSRSMQRNDPDKLRNQGTKMLFQLLGDDDRIALVTFDKSAQVRSGFKDVLDKDSGEFEKLVEETPDEGGFTDLKSGLEEALKLINSDSRPHAETAVLLLSDGKMDPHPDISTPRQQTINVFKNLFPGYKRLGVSVHTVALSEQSDRELLSNFSKETGGLYFYAPSSEELSKAFTDLFVSVADPQLISLNSEAFLIDNSVSEATFLVNKVSEGSVVIIKDPLGTELTAETAPSAYSWYTAKNFDIITIKNPLRGNWQVLGVRPGSGFASVVTDLRLVVDGPEGATEIGIEKRVFVRAKLFQGDQPIGSEDLSGALSALGYRLYDSDTGKLVHSGSLKDIGTNGDVEAGDKEFSASIPVRKTGDYELTVSAIAPTFSREKRLVFRAYNQKLALSEEVETGNYKIVVSDETLAVTGTINLVASNGEMEPLSFPVTKAEKTENFETIMTVENVELPSGNWELVAQWQGIDQYDVQQTIHSNTIKVQRAVAVQPVADSGESSVELGGIIPILAALIALGSSGVVFFLGLSMKTPTVEEDLTSSLEIPEEVATAIKALGERVSGSERQLPEEDFSLFKPAVTSNPPSAEHLEVDMATPEADSEVNEEDAQAILDAFENSSEPADDEVAANEEAEQDTEEDTEESEENTEDAEQPEDEDEQQADDAEESPADEDGEETPPPEGPSDDEVAQMLASLGQSVDEINDKK